MLDITDLSARVAEILDEHQGVEGPLLPILHAVQEAYGHVPAPALEQIAKALDITKAEIWGVMTFYHDFRQEPAGRNVLKLCRAESCQARGADRLAAHAQSRLGVDWHQTTPDGRVTLEPVFCLGLCASGPAALVNGKVVARLDEERLDRITGGLR